MIESNSGRNNIITTGHDNDISKKKKWEDMLTSQFILLMMLILNI
jgi:hypothetical protein